MLNVLASLFGVVILPAAVVAELAAQIRFPVIDIALFPFLQISSPTNHAFVTQLQTELDAGEAEAIVLASELHAEWLLIDERHGRQIAHTHGIQTTGVLGVLIRAKANGHVLDVGTSAQKLRDELGFHLTDAVINEARRLAGEP